MERKENKSAECISVQLTCCGFSLFEGRGLIFEPESTQPYFWRQQHWVSFCFKLIPLSQLLRCADVCVPAEPPCISLG